MTAKPNEPESLEPCRFNEQDIARFWESVDRRSPEECWPWKGYRKPPELGAISGYGHANYHDKTYRAHRVSYEITHNGIDDAMKVDHLCRNPCCVNPAHLELVTNRVNVLRGVGPSARAARRDKCIRGHPYTEESMKIRADGARACRICIAENSSNKRIRDRAKMKGAKGNG